MLINGISTIQFRLAQFQIRYLNAKKILVLQSSTMLFFWSGILKMLGSLKTVGELIGETKATFMFQEKILLTAILANSWLHSAVD
jgi:hypothetical protein